MNMLSPFRDLPIRYKLFLTYSAVTIAAITLGSAIIYSLVSTTLQENIESELKNSTSAILSMVKTSVEVSIKNHLRAVGEKNREIVAHFYDMVRSGALTEAEARERAESVLLSQRIGETGYIYCLDSRGVVQVHPNRELKEQDVSTFDFVRRQIADKEGYIEYEWRNPGEVESRPKALFMTYFAPWDWIISVSSYRSEFHTLVNIHDFRDSILELRFGQTGYSFVVDGKGNMVLHPKLEGSNAVGTQEAQDRSVIEEIQRLKNGKIVYSWMNPGETRARAKLAMFNTIPELGWVVASSSYLDEFNAPLHAVRNIFITMIILSVLLVLPLTVRISAAITNPLQELMNRFASGVPGDFSARVARQSGDELGRLTSYFNLFMERLEHYNEKLQGEILERKQAEADLRLSQEMFSKAFRLNPNGICIISLGSGRLINVNESFLLLTGYTREEILDRDIASTGIFGAEEKVRSLLDLIDRQVHLHNHELDVLTKSGKPGSTILSAEVIEIRDERCTLLTMEDVTDRRHLERQIMEIGDRERQRIGQDLHDDLCAHLIGIEVLSEVLNRKLGEQASPDAAFAGRIRELISEAIEKTRRLARGLCPVHLVAYGLESALKELCLKVSEVINMTCDLRCQDSLLIDDNTVATQLFYIAREAVQNAIKHAAAQRITIDLFSDGARITLRVEDDGVGMPETVESEGMGLRIMSHRASMINASLELKRSSWGGATVECCVRPTRGKETMNGQDQG